MSIDGHRGAATYGTTPKRVKFGPVVDDVSVGEAEPVAALFYDDWSGHHFRSSSKSREISPAAWLNEFAPPPDGSVSTAEPPTGP
ncbi:MAG: hypothetical protein EPN50_01080 [Chloroflexota bacterium]|nr:MAG: hypothetical protein EPN50_01080 [Chloroflexota bacterium]